MKKGYIPPTIAETNLSRRTLNVLAKQGYEANDSILNVAGGYKDFLKWKGCGPKSAMELSKCLARNRRKFGQRAEKEASR